MSTLLSRRDFTDVEVRKDCGVEFDRAELAGSDEALARWVRRWGGALREFLIGAAPIFDELEALREENNDLEAELEGPSIDGDLMKDVEAELESLKSAIEDGESKKDLLAILSDLSKAVAKLDEPACA